VTAPDVDPAASEKPLVERTQQGDRSAFEEIYRANVRRVHGLCRRLTGNALEAEDMTQEAFGRQRDALSPETAPKVDENLMVIEDAVSQIQAELGKDPGNRELERMLVTVPGIARSGCRGR
jgi:hypothetical protein